MCRIRDELAELLVDELTYVSCVVDYTWQRLARVVGGIQSWLALRSDTTRFITRSVLMQLRRSPWALTFGDVDRNLDALATQSHTPRDDAGAKIQSLVRMN